jgi:hypothetical protein
MVAAAARSIEDYLTTTLTERAAVQAVVAVALTGATIMSAVAMASAQHIARTNVVIQGIPTQGNVVHSAMMSGAMDVQDMRMREEITVEAGLRSVGAVALRARTCAAATL